MEKYVVGVGGANLDMHARSRNPVVMRDSNPSYMHTSAGGVTRNIIENLARQGVNCKLLTAVGNDSFGDRILRSCREAGVDVTRVYVSMDFPSSCYFALTDQVGDMLIGASDMRIVENLPFEYLDENRELLQNAEAVVCDTNPSREFIGHLTEIVDGKTPIFIDPVSTTYSKKLEGLYERIYLAKPNLIELEMLSGVVCSTDDGIRRAADILLEKGLSCIAVSLGGRGCYYADRQGREMFRSLRRVETMTDATGAGDAFMAGLVHGWCEGMEPESFIEYALASGIIAVNSTETINPDMSDALVKATIEEYRIV